MADLGKKISELQETTDLAGLYTIGTDKNTQSKKVSLQFLKEAADYANSQGDYAKEVGDTVAGNVGVNAYPTFSASTQYAAGSVVNYNGKLYRFTSLHPAGAWVGTDAVLTSIKAEADLKLTELESEVIGKHLNISSYDKVFHIISADNTWYSAGTHRVIPVSKGERYNLSPSITSYYAWLTDAYDASNTTGNAPILAGTTINKVISGEEESVAVPEGAAYLYIVNENGSWDVVTWQIIREGDIPMLTKRIDDAEKVTEVMPDIQIDFSKLAAYSYIIAGTEWYGVGKHRVMKVSEGEILVISSLLYDTYYAWLTDAYTPPTSAGGAAPVVENTSIIKAEKGQEIRIVVPKGAAYLYLVSEDGNWIAQSWNIKKCGYFTNTETRLNQLENVVSPLQSETINLAALPKGSYVIAGTEWYGAGSHKAIPIIAGGTYKIRSIGIASYYAWLTDAYTPPTSTSANIPFADGTSAMQIAADIDVEVVAPNDAAYLYIVNETGAWVATNFKVEYIGELTKIGSNLVELADDITEVTKLIDLSKTLNFEYGTCYDGGNSMAFEYTTSAIRIANREAVSLRKCIIFSPNADFRIIKKNTNGIVTLYNFASGIIRLDEGEYYMAIRPSEQNEIADINEFIGRFSIFEEGSAGYVALSKPIPFQQNQPKGVFAIMTYNVGRWYNGSGADAPTEKFDKFYHLQNNIIARYCPDIMLLQEWSDMMGGRNITDKLLRNYYANILSFTSGNYDGKGICTNLEISNFSKVDFWDSEGDLSRNYARAEAYLNGRKVLLLSAHLSIDADVCSSNIEQLIADMNQYEYCILGADINQDVRDVNSAGYQKTIKKFLDAGYTLSNNELVSVESEGLAIDSLVLSENIKVKSTIVDSQKKGIEEGSDHYPLVSYLEIY